MGIQLMEQARLDGAEKDVTIGTVCAYPKLTPVPFKGDLVELIAELTALDGEIRWDPSKPDGQPRRAMDTSRAPEQVGFEARMPWKDGRRRTIDRARAGLAGGGDVSTRRAGSTSGA